MRILDIVAILLLQWIAVSALAQNTELKFNLVEGTNGKPLGKINAVTQDRHGYLWFCGSVERCLYRYDGNRITAFRQDDSNPNSLGMTILETVYADRDGLIWIGGDGLDQYNPATGIFKHYKHDKSDTGSLAVNSVNSILRDRQGRLWVGTANGLDRLDERTGKFIHYRNTAGNLKSLSSNFVWRLYEDQQGILWIATGYPFANRDPEDGGLNKLNADGTFTRYMHDPKNPNSLINNKVAAMFEDSRGIFWVGTGGDGLHTMDRKTGKFERHRYDPNKPEQLSRPPILQGKDSEMIKNDKITFITGDVTGAIWIGTMYSGINRYDPQTKKITHFENSNGFPDSGVWNAYNSKEGVLWICAENSGLFYRVEPFRKSITSITTNNLVSNFLEDKEGYLWVATRGGGLFKYDQHNNFIGNYRHNPADSLSLPGNNVGALFQNGDGNIWVGTDFGFRVLDKAGQKFSRFRVDGNVENIPDSGITHITQDKFGFIWFSTWGKGLVRYNPKDHSINHFISNAKDSFSISSNEVGEILPDEAGVIWASGSNGVNRLNTKTKHVKHYLQNVWGSHLFKDDKGTLWTGNQNGLFHYDPKEDRFSISFDPQQQMNGYTVGGLVQDDEKNLWLPSQVGIIKLDPLSKETFIYGSKYGIDPQSLVLWAKTYKNGKGQIFIPHGSGFYTFSPGQLAVKTDFKILITDLFINSHSVLPGEQSPIKKPAEEIVDLNLKYNQNNITLNFAAIDYRQPELTRYFTMLENYDNTWREVKGEKSSYYFNLSKGKYIYRIKAFNIDGTKAEKQIFIRIHPPWWETWWAYSLYFIMLIGAVWTFIRWRTRSLQKEKVMLEKRVIERTRELKHEKEIVESTLTELKSTQAQLIQSEKMASLGELTAGIAHEIQNPLNFVNNFSELSNELIDEMQEEIDKGNTEVSKDIGIIIKNNLEKILHHGRRADAIVKGMLEHSRASTGHKQLTAINALADEYLRLSYEGLRAKDKTFTATLQTDFDESIGKINLVPQDIGRVLLNLYNNAFYSVTGKNKQLPEGYNPTVSVNTKKLIDNPDNYRVEITITDNGTGISKKILDKIFQPFFTTKPTGQGTGLGLSLSYDIIKAHGGEITVTTKEGEGAIFCIRLPQ